MFYEIFTNLCDEKSISPTATLQNLKISTSKLTAWKNGSLPSASVLILLSEFFQVSIDYLLTGKEKSSSKDNLSNDEQELLTYYSKLHDINKGKVIGTAKTLAELQSSDAIDNSESKQLGNRDRDIHIQTVRVSARSFDDAPPRMVTGDFSDILNAPDATDEY